MQPTYPPNLLRVFGISNCDTVKKAINWLKEEGLKYEFHDFKKQGVPLELLDLWLDVLGYAKILNTKGTTWRKLDTSLRESITNTSSAKALILNYPSILKRPIILWPDQNWSVGFDTDEWKMISKRSD
tara:strand:+ start:797 stop:1180 length:384 start_codon:yes stop_codon:yes gene_type:complete